MGRLSEYADVAKPTPDQTIKQDANKLPWDLVPVDAIEDVVEVFQYGAKKYGFRAWEREGITWLRIWGAIMRHLWAWRRGENKDRESGLNHLAHAAWGCFALLEYHRTWPERDDRRSPISKLLADKRKADQEKMLEALSWKGPVGGMVK